MAKTRTITHAYRMPGGWEETERLDLTGENARMLSAQGFTLIRTRRGWRSEKELSLASYLGSSLSPDASTMPDAPPPTR